MAEKYTLVVDTSKCVGCRGCQTACKNWNELPAEIEKFKGDLQTHKDVSPNTYTIVKYIEKYENGKVSWKFIKRQCMHCTDATCEKVCPVGAISHTEKGQVIRDKERCIGCGYCAQNCPFGVAKLNVNEKKMYKCPQCWDRVANGLLPACAKACPPGAIQYGPRSEIIARSKERLARLKEKNPKANLYGTDILGGTNVLYILEEEPEYYGLPKHPIVPVSVTVWQNMIQPLGRVLPVAALGAVAFSAFMTRVMKRDSDYSKDKGGVING